MKQLTLLIALLSMGCGDRAVRDTKVLKAELSWLSLAALRQASHLRSFVLGHPECVCAPDKAAFVNAACNLAARDMLTVETRVPWHRAMAEYNSGVTTERPSQTPPAIPSIATLCQKGTP